MEFYRKKAQELPDAIETFNQVLKLKFRLKECLNLIQKAKNKFTSQARPSQAHEFHHAILPLLQIQALEHVLTYVFLSFE